MCPTWSNPMVDAILSKDGRSLAGMGVNNWVLSRKSALLAIKRLKEINIPILGGDVYVMYNGQIESTCDSWYCDSHSFEAHSDFVERSATVAEEYITKYIKESDNILFAVVPMVR